MNKKDQKELAHTASLFSSDLEDSELGEIPKDRVYQEFVYLAATKRKSIEHFARLADGGAYPAINGSVVRELQIILPSKELCQFFHLRICSLFEGGKINEKENSLLENLRDTLLPKLLAGEIDLSNIKLDKNVRSA